MARNGKLDDVDTVDLVDEILARTDLDETDKRAAKHEMLTHCGYEAKPSWVKSGDKDKRNGNGRRDDEFGI